MTLPYVRLLQLVRLLTVLSLFIGCAGVPVVQREERSAVFVDVSYVSDAGPGRMGSGVVVYSDGRLSEVLTARHMVTNLPEDAHDVSVYVKTFSGQVCPAVVEDISEESDLALLAVACDAGVPVKLAGSEGPVGSPVTAVGFPIGYHQAGCSTVTAGVLGAQTDVDGETLVNLSVPIIHGNSGGGVFDSDGHLVGIVVRASERWPYISFMVPLEDVRKFLKP